MTLPFRFICFECLSSLQRESFIQMPETINYGATTFQGGITQLIKSLPKTVVPFISQATKAPEV